MFDSKCLEFEKILEKISSYSILDENINRIKELYPSTDKDAIFMWQNETYNALNVLYRIGKFDFDSFNISKTIDRIRIGSLLNINEFIQLLKLFQASSILSSYYKRIELLDNIDISYIKNYFLNINSLKDERILIENVFDDDGLVKDSASTELYQIRRNIRKIDSDITNILNKIIKENESKLTESLITIRNTHKVIPVKIEYKKDIKGIIYDESSSHQTVYIEPYAVSELESKILLLKQDEQVEIEKILYQLSNKIFESYDSIKTNYDNILSLDFIYSKALYAREINASLVETSEFIRLFNARHPLIDKDKVVSNNIVLDKKTMIITGPNTGGKTVILKTIGLFSLMNQCGILLPVDENSSIPIFSSIYADIGDEQSIEQSLSTFSSHMKKIVSITNDVTDSSLVLLDELGSGTDPKEGASLAISILNYLRSINSYTIATTHYPELKMYAYNNEDILNVSVEFDNVTLKPTYKLFIGFSGKSNAFLISERLGLSNSIIENAKSISLDFNDSNSLLIENLEKKSLELNKEYDEFNKLKEELTKTKKEEIEFIEKEKQKLKKRQNELYQEKNKYLEKAQKEAFELLNEIKDIKTNLLNNKDVKDNIIIDLKGKANSLIKDKFIGARKTNNSTIKVNDYVRLIDYNQIGQVTKIKDNKYYVQIGSFNSVYTLDKIEYVEMIDNIKSIKKRSNESSIHNNISARLDLRGMRYDEAKEALDKFIDDALLSNLESVDVIHGYGTLALRNMVIDYCKTNNNVVAYRSGNENEGGRGVTIINLK